MREPGNGRKKMLLLGVIVAAAASIACGGLFMIRGERADPDPVAELKQMPLFPRATVVTVFEDTIDPKIARKGLLRFWTLDEAKMVHAFYEDVASKGGWQDLSVGWGGSFNKIKTERHFSGLRSPLLEGSGGDLLVISFNSIWRGLYITSFSSHVDQATNKYVVEVNVELEIWQEPTTLP